MIDVDDAEQAEKMMQIVEDLQIRCRVTCTKRGKHFTFRNSGVDKCGTDLKLACGLAYLMLSAIVPINRKISCETIPTFSLSCLNCIFLTSTPSIFMQPDFAS